MPPLPRVFPNRETEFTGLSLRDYFAGHALQGLLASGVWSSAKDHKSLTKAAYNLSDHMLAHRDATDPDVEQERIENMSLEELEAYQATVQQEAERAAKIRALKKKKGSGRRVIQ
jgi:hypothetical protein